MNRFNYLNGYKYKRRSEIRGFFVVGDKVRLKKNIWENLPWDMGRGWHAPTYRSKGTVQRCDDFGYIVQWEERLPISDKNLWVVDELEFVNE